MKRATDLRLLAATLPLLIGLTAWQSVGARSAAPPGRSAAPPRRSTAPPAPPPQAPARPPQTPPARAGSEVLGTVDGIPITKFEWDRLADPYFEEVQARAGRELTQDERNLLRKNVLNELVRERLWVADARRRGFAATEAEIDAHLQMNPYFKTNGKFDPAKFREYKFSPASNYRDIKEQVEKAVLLDKYVKWMRTRYAPSEPELKRHFAEQMSQASIRYFWLTADAVSLEPGADAAQVRAYYENHPEEFQSPEEARITYIRVPIEPSTGASDSVRVLAEGRALVLAKALLGAVTSAKSPDAAAKEFGGVKDSGPFRMGDPIKGLGRSDALVEAIRAARLKKWLPEPIRIGPYFAVVRLEERREASVRPFREVVGLAKRKADGLLRDAELDSVARLEYAAHPERYRVPMLRAVVLARPTASFDDPRPISDRDVARTLERIRKGAGIPDTARAWADSVIRTLPDLVRRERQIELGFRTMAEAGGRLKRDRPEEVARKHGATLTEVSLYKGQPPAQPMLLEGAFLDSLYAKSAGTVAGPRVLRDSIFIVRVLQVDDSFQPPFDAVRTAARTEVDTNRRREVEREGRTYFEARRARYPTPHRWELDYVRFRKLAPDSAPVPGDSIRAYYEKNPAEFTVPGKAHARHILIGYRPGDGAGARAAARKKAQEVLKRAKSGEDFAALAKEHSEDRASAAQGGDLGEITRAQVVKEFGDAAFSLKPGEISNLIETQYGFHVIKLESITPQRVRTLDESRDEIRGVLGLALVDSLARAAAERFAAEVSRPGASFEESAKAHGGATSTPPLSGREPIAELGTVPGLESEIAPLPEGGVTRPIPVRDGYIVARVKRSISPQHAPFGEVKDAVIREMQGERRRAIADSLDVELTKAIAAGADLETLLVPHGGLRVSRSFPRRGPIPELVRDSLLGRDSTLLSEIFASRPGTVLKPRHGALGTLYAVVDSVLTPSTKEFAEHREALKRDLFEQRSAAWTDRLRARAKIQLYRKDLTL